MEFIANLCKLTPSFFEKFPHEIYPEILVKPNRPYTCLLVEWNDCFICIPFRSSIKHNEAFIFKNSVRSKKGRSGLDYKKIVITRESADIDTVNIVIDKDEYNIAQKYMSKIEEEVFDYISTYKEHITGERVLNEKDFNRKYKYSTIEYFKSNFI